MSSIIHTLAATAAVLAASTATASAAGFERADSPYRAPDSVRSKTATATCPPGLKVLGTGAEINGGRGRVSMDRIVPSATLTSVTAGATENRDGITDNWTISAYAVCASPPPGLQLIPAAETTPVASNQYSTATCPPGKATLGAGGELVGANGRIVMSHVTPDRSVHSVTVASHEDADPTSIPWSVRAYAICAAPLQGMTRIEAHSSWLYPANPNYAVATCPAGTRVIGAGGAAEHRPEGEHVPYLEGHHFIDDLMPDSTLESVRVFGYDGQRAFGIFDVTAVAICAVPPGGAVGQPGHQA